MPTADALKRRALSRFENAVRDHEMLGSLHPDDHAAVEKEYKRAKELLLKHLELSKDKAK